MRSRYRCFEYYSILLVSERTSFALDNLHVLPTHTRAYSFACAADHFVRDAGLFELCGVLRGVPTSHIQLLSTGGRAPFGRKLVIVLWRVSIIPTESVYLNAICMKDSRFANCIAVV